VVYKSNLRSLLPCGAFSPVVPYILLNMSTEHSHSLFYDGFITKSRIRSIHFLMSIMPPIPSFKTWKTDKGEGQRTEYEWKPSIFQHWVLLHGPVNQLWNREIVPSASLGLIRHKHTHTQSTNEEPDTTDLGMGVIIRSTPLKQSHPDRYADKIIVTKYHIIGYQPISNC